MEDPVRWDVSNVRFQYLHMNCCAAFIRPEIKYGNDSDDFHPVVRGETIIQLLNHLGPHAELIYSLYAVRDERTDHHIDDFVCAGEAKRRLAEIAGEDVVRRLVMGPVKED